MKKITAIILVLAMLVSMCACGSKPAENQTEPAKEAEAAAEPEVKAPVPEDTVAAFCEAMKEFDLNKMDSFVEDASGDVELGTGEDDEETEALLEICRKVSQDISYNITGSVVNGDTADVTVDFKFKDGGQLMAETLADYFMQALALAFSGGSEEELAALLPQILSEKTESVGFGEASQTITFPCREVNGEWKISEVPEDTVNVMTANLFKALEEFDPDSMDLGLDDFSTGEDDSRYASVEYALEDEVIADDEFGTVTVQSVAHDGWWSTEVSILCENKTADKNLTFSANNVSVNGYAIDPYFGADVPAGKKSVEKMNFEDDDFEEIGIDSLDELKFTLVVTDSDDWLGDALAEYEIAIYPTGLTASEVTVPERRVAENETVLVDNDEMTFIVLGTAVDDFWGYMITCYAENKTDKPVTFSWDDVSVNDFMCDPYWCVSVPAHCRAYDDVMFSDYTIEDTGLTFDDFEKIDFTLSVYDNSTWDAVEFFNEDFTLQVK